MKPETLNRWMATASFFGAVGAFGADVMDGKIDIESEYLTVFFLVFAIFFASFGGGHREDR